MEFIRVPDLCGLVPGCGNIIWLTEYIITSLYSECLWAEGYLLFFTVVGILFYKYMPGKRIMEHFGFMTGYPSTVQQPMNYGKLVVVMSVIFLKYIPFILVNWVMFGPSSPNILF